MRTINPDHPDVAPEQIPSREGLNDTFFHSDTHENKTSLRVHAKKMPVLRGAKPEFSIRRAFAISIGMAIVTGGYLLLLIVVLGLASDPFYAIATLAFSFFALLVALFFSWTLYVSFNAFCSEADVRPSLVALCSAPAITALSLAAYNVRKDPVLFALLLLSMAIALCIVLYIVYVTVHALRPQK